MSKIAELLKLAEQKKVEKPAVETAPKTDVTSLPKNIEVNSRVKPKNKFEESRVSTVSQPSTLSQVGTDSTVSQPSTVATGSLTSAPMRSQSIAPEKDFQKVANSVVRGVSQGVFNGKSKQMYDYLYSLTRGAIQPKRTVRISKPKLMKGTGIGSPQTFYRNINYLESIGLIKRTEIIGEWDGNEYEVFVPEEINLKSVQSVQSVQSDNSPQKQVVLVVPETELTVLSSQPINTGDPATPKTSFKDSSNTDDETCALFIKKFEEVSRELTGNGVNPKDAERWEKLAELLILELHAAARRTQITSVPAFLTEHLRRKLLNVPAPSKASKIKVDTVGKNEAGDYEIKSLDEKGREAALEQLREFAGDDFLEDFKKWYTEEDWIWLRMNLEAK